MCRKLVAKWSCLKISCDFFSKIFSKTRATVVRQTYDVRANVVNLSPQHFGEFTVRNIRNTRTNAVRMSYDSCATVVRKHANISRLSGDKIKVSGISMNVVRHFCEYLANENEKEATFVGTS